MMKVSLSYRKGNIITAVLLLFLCSSFNFNHKFYVSVTQIEYSESNRAIQITSRIFIDDLEKALNQRYDMEVYLGSDKEIEKADYWIEKYLNSRLKFTLNGRAQKLTFLGKKYDNDLVVCFLEIENISLKETNQFDVENQLLTDVFDDQQNITHITLNTLKKSFVFNKESNKGMLNF